jgi:hypothetical protein
LSEAYASAPVPSFRLIPSKFPPIGVFDTVSTAADLVAVMDLVGWTNDRMVAERVARLPQSEWVYGRANASIVMAAFLHAAPGGMRFNGPDLGAWYASERLTTAIVEVAHHLRREARDIRTASLARTYRTYRAEVAGSYLDIRGQQASRPEVYASDSYAVAQVLGEGLRSDGRDGLMYSSLRHVAGVNVVAYRPPNVLNVVQADHFELLVQAASNRIEARRLAS